MEVKNFRLKIIRGPVQTAKKVVIYGPEGIGKSTLAAQFPAPLFLDVEKGTRALNVDRAELDSWTELRETLAALHAERGGGYKTIVIDSADWAERLCTSHICTQSKKSGIEDFGYGKGYIYLKEEYAAMLEDCNRLIADNIHIVFTAHAAMRKFEQPDERGSYDRWEMKLTKYDAPMLKEWADIVLFCNYRTYTQKQENGKYKVTGGERTMYTTHNPCWDAKNRYSLPDELPMDYSRLRAVIEIKEPAIEPPPPLNAEQLTPEPPPALMCADCGKEITGVGTANAQAIATRSLKLFGRQLCCDCAVKQKNKTEKGE